MFFFFFNAFFFKAELHPIVYMYHNFPIYSSVDGHLVNKQNNTKLRGPVVYNTIKPITDTKGSSVIDFKCERVELIIEC